MATPEGRVKSEVKELLAEHEQDLWCNWPVPGGYGVPMLDCIGAHKGRAFAIETKRPGETLTPRQQFTKEEMERGGIRVFVIGENMDAERQYSGMMELKVWLRE